MISFIRIAQFLMFVFLAIPSMVFMYFTDVLVELIVRYQTRTRKCKDCREDFYE